MDLNQGNDLSSTVQSVLNVTSASQFGYRINAYETQLMTRVGGAETIPDFPGSYEAPDNWESTCNSGGSAFCGFGFTTDDAALPGPDPDRFTTATGVCTTAPCYAAFAPLADAPGDIVGDLSTSIENDLTIITYRVSVGFTQTVGQYQTTVIYIATPQF
jgi:hypothetical protein